MTTYTDNEEKKPADSQLQALLNAALAGDGGNGGASDGAAAKDPAAATADTPRGGSGAANADGTKGAKADAKGAATDAKDAASDAKEGAANAKDGQGKAKDGAPKGKAGGGDRKKGDGGDDRNPLKTFTQLVRERATESDTRPTATLTLRKIIGGDILNTEVVRRQIGVFLLATLFVILYITNRYVCQRDLVQIDKLTKELKDAKYRALSTGSELTEKSRESRVLEMLRTCKDSTLHIASQPPYIISVPADEGK